MSSHGSMVIFFFFICKPVYVLGMLLLVVGLQFPVFIKPVFHLKLEHVVQPILCAWDFDLFLC